MLDSYTEVRKRVVGNKYRVFSKRSGSNLSGHERIFEREFPEIHIDPKFKISKNDAIFTIGSCFARNIEGALMRRGILPLTMSCKIPDELYQNTGIGARNGALNAYTPPSMLDILRLSGRVNHETAGALQVDDDKWYDMMLTGTRAMSLLELRGVRRRVFDVYSRLSDASVVIITLGYTESWFDNRDKIFVNRSPAGEIATSRHADRYGFSNYDTAQTVETLEKIVADIRERTFGCARVLFTVSPVPLNGTYTNRDVITANLYSKSVLLSSAVLIAQKYDYVDYFPSYEMATLNDQRATWEDDGVHVKLSVVDKIVARFVWSYMEEKPSGL